jgi:hypothetical protein
MGGFTSHDECLRGLRRAARLLYLDGQQDEAEAVAQAVILLEARPTLTRDVFNDRVAEVLRESGMVAVLNGSEL